MVPLVHDPWEQKYWPTKFHWSALQIGQDSSIYVLDIILGSVSNVMGHLICIFYTFLEHKYLRN